MAYYQTSPTEPHPIDVAAAGLWVTALCGEQPATRAAAEFRPFRVDGGPLVTRR
jgi:D-alanyl-D-alanine carboxypeptidase